MKLFLIILVTLLFQFLISTVIFTLTRRIACGGKTVKYYLILIYQPTGSMFCIGTDINRNFDYGWSKPGASGNPCSEAYYGTSAFSTNEATAISNYILASKPIAYIGIFFVIHCFRLSRIFTTMDVSLGYNIHFIERS